MDEIEILNQKVDLQFELIQTLTKQMDIIFELLKLKED